MLWAITTLFNAPHGSQRWANYQCFRAALTLPLLTVECLGDDGDFALRSCDADRLVQRRGGARLWQKERLLNLALAALPNDCTAIAALDADVLLPDADWPLALRALRDHALVQPFTRACYLPKGVTAPDTHQVVGEQGALAKALGQGTSADAAIGPQPGDGRGGTTGGLAVVLPRALIARHGFYPYCISGGGDTALAAAACGVPQAAIVRHAMTAAQQRAYLGWAAPFHAEVQGRVTALGGTLWHLWHGPLAARDASQRHTRLAAAGFDPLRDLRDVPGEAWHWSGANPALAPLLADYLAARGD